MPEAAPVSVSVLQLSAIHKPGKAMLSRVSFLIFPVQQLPAQHND